MPGKFLNEETKKRFEEEDEQLNQSTEDRLSQLQDDDDPMNDLDPEDDPQENDPEDDPQEDDDPEDDPEDDPQEDDPQEDDPQEDDELEIPSEYLSAAEHQGWTEEEVVELYQNNQELAEKTMKKLYDATNFISQQASDFARQRKEHMEAVEKTKGESEKPAYKGLDIEKIKKEYGDDLPPGIVELLAAQDSQMEEAFNSIQELKSVKADKRQATQEEAALLGKIEGFFETQASAGYDGHYGKTERGDQWDRVLTGEQMRARLSLVEEADAIYAGFEFRGKPISYDEALERAHLAMTSKIRESAVRKDISTKIKRRNKGLTVKSSKAKTKRTMDDGNDPPKDPKKNENWLKKRTKARFKKLGFGGGSD